MDISFQIFCRSLECDQLQTKSTISSQITVFALTFSFVKVTVSISPLEISGSSLPLPFQWGVILAIQCPSQDGSCLSPPNSFCHYHGRGLIPLDLCCVTASELVFLTQVHVACHHLIDPNIFSTLTPLAKNFRLPAGQSPCPWARRSWAFRAWSHPFKPQPLPALSMPCAFLPLYISSCFSFPFCLCSSHSLPTEWHLSRIQIKSFLDFHSQAILLPFPNQ